jgi:type I restriction enzyme S subunit
MNNWKLIKAEKFIDFNPRESIQNGVLAKKVAMEQLKPFTRDISTYEIAPFNGGSKFRNGDTLMARITPCLENGKTAQVNILEDGEVGFGSTEFTVMRAKPDLSDKDFIYYWATSPFLREIAIKSMSGSSGRQRVQQSVLNNIEFLVPPLEEQIKIGHTLRVLDDKIANNIKINHHLEQMAQAIFKSWFVDFEPFGGKMPGDWQVVKFSTFLTPRIEKSNDPAIPLFSVTDMGIYPRAKKFNKTLSKANTKNKIARETDLVFGMSREILNWGIMRSPVGGVSSAYNVFAVNEGINSKYFESFIKSHPLYFKNLIHPATREGQGVDKESLMLKFIYLPPDEILIQYYTIEDALTAQIREKEAESVRLSLLRDTLLPRLMSGEFTIADVDAK